MAQKYSNYYIYRPGIDAPSGSTLRKSSPDLGRRLVFLTWLFVLSFGIYFVYSKHTQAISARHDASIAQAASEAAARQKFAAGVQQIIDKNPQSTYSVSVVDVNNGSSVKVGAGKAMNAASCGKVLTAALFLHEVEKNQVSLRDRLGGKTSRYQLQQLIQKSDDDAWVLFNNKLTHAALATYAHNLGLTSYEPDTDSISSFDMSVLLKKLYKGDLLNAEHTSLLLSYMQNTNYEQFIVPAVPPGDNVYHKVGFVDGEINDAAIITKDNRAFALTVFSNGNDLSDQYTRAQTIQEITKAALNLL
jgi:beta-lactamase class A